MALQAVAAAIVLLGPGGARSTHDGGASVS